MKKILALVLVLSMVLGSFGFAFAATTAENNAGQVLKELGVLKGDAQGNLMLDTVLNRQDIIVLLSRLMGAEDEASKFPIPSAYTDITDDYYKTFIGWAQVEGLTNGIGDNKFGFDQELTVKELATFLLRALGHEDAWDKAETLAVELGLVATGVNFEAKASRGVMAEATLSALNAPLANDSKTSLGASLELPGFDLVSVLAVDSIKANTAKSFQVEFNRPVTEEDKVTFSVKRLTSELSVTTTWNEDKTVATLASSANLADASFVVSVSADAQVVASESITITPQKVSRIEFTSKNVAVNLSTGVGFVTYKVFDQYDNDITTSYLANNMTFQSGAVAAGGSVVGRNGTITLTPGGNPLIQFPNISIVVYDTTSGISATVTLPTASAVGTLSSFELGSVENVKLVENDVTSIYYIPFTAKDMSGNETKDYDLITGGLIFNNAGTTDLVVSLPGIVSVQIVRDPANTKNAAVEVKALSGASLVMDMPVTITAMTFAGTSSSVQTTVVKAKVLNSVTLLAPATTVSTGETPDIQFEAYDQFGNRVTRHADIVGKVSPTGVTLEKNVDGSAKFKMISVGTKGLVQLSVVVPATGKMSTININVQDAAKPSRIVIDSSKIVAAMENGAIQKINFNGQTPGGITVYDQYDRVMSASKVNAVFNTGTAYRINVTNQTGNVTLGTAVLNSATDLTLTANAPTGGADTIKFELEDVVAGKTLSTGALSVSVIKTADIVDYTMEITDKAIYAAGTSTDKEQAYAATAEVFGKTASGAKVLLAGTPIISASVGNSNDFDVLATFPAAYDAVEIGAKSLALTNKTSEKTVVAVNVFHNGGVNALTAELTSSSVAPVATTIVTRSTTEDKITLSNADFLALVTKSFAMYDSVGDSTTTANAYFRVTDSYGTYGMTPANYVVDVVNGTVTLGVAADGTITTATAATAGVVRVTGITNNGLMKTIEITVLAP